MRALEMYGQSVRRGVRRHRTEGHENRRTVGRTPAGHFPEKLNTHKYLQLSGWLSGAVRPVEMAAVCPVGVSLGHPTPDTRTLASQIHEKGA